MAHNHAHNQLCAAAPDARRPQGQVRSRATQRAHRGTRGRVGTGIWGSQRGTGISFFSHGHLFGSPVGASQKLVSYIVQFFEHSHDLWSPPQL